MQFKVSLFEQAYPHLPSRRVSTKKMLVFTNWQVIVHFNPAPNSINEQLHNVLPTRIVNWLPVFVLRVDMVRDQPLRVLVLELKVARHSKRTQHRAVPNLLLLHFIPVYLSCDVRHPINELTARNNVTRPNPLLKSLHLLHREFEKPVWILVDPFCENVRDPLIWTPNIENFVPDNFALLNYYFFDSIKLSKINLLRIILGRIRVDFICNVLCQKQVLLRLFLHFYSGFICWWVEFGDG